MTAFLVRRLLRFFVVCIGVSLVTFAILHASGDPVSLIMPEAPEADRAKLREALGLTDPLAFQFLRFVGNVSVGNFGKSFFHHGQQASHLVLERMPTTLTLTAAAMLLAIVVAVPVGIYSAVRLGRLRHDQRHRVAARVKDREGDERDADADDHQTEEPPDQERGQRGSSSAPGGLGGPLESPHVNHFGFAAKSQSHSSGRASYATFREMPSVSFCV